VWLAAMLTEARPEKVLVICHYAETAIALERQLRVREGVRCAAFHEGMSIIERDRAAAYFAGGAVDDEAGADALVCSEIGSEGRNFQFAHHLVLFDLPFNPDLLEQRIGRLDRIGQRDTVQIHVPYLTGTAQEVLFRWYHEGLDTFTASCPAAYAVFERFHSELESALAMPSGDHAALLAATREFTAEANAALAAGRDRLLELNSCDPERAGELIAGIEEEEASGGLKSYMEEVFNQYGVNADNHSAGCLIVQASDQMLTDHFPGLSDDALTVTFDRARALAREDMSFLSWEHPLVTEAMAMIRDSDFGSAAVIAITTRSLPAGTLLLEAYFTVETVAEPGLRLGRFLPPAVARALVDERGRDLAAKLDHERLNAIYEPLPHEVARSVVTAVRGKLDAMIDGAQLAADGALPALRGTAHARAARLLDAEIERMVAQRELNPAIRDDEIDYLRHEKEAVLAAIERASMQMKSLRLIVSR
ncbi:MAG: RNA polymerase-associated protein RapA, partial [Gammaproteobacteria bacterium]|nr:RNA polymerase-associated protein RapA [Gammaproteobacteria bacterium]